MLALGLAAAWPYAQEPRQPTGAAPLGSRPAEARSGQPSGPASPTKWTWWPGRDKSFFPIAVWLQDPQKAGRYRAAGFNLYVGLWRGPTEGQLAMLKAAGMKVICEQNAVGLKHLNDPTIVGWMHGDEPDNAQSLGRGQGYGPPIPPERIIGEYERIRAADPARPVMLNLGQGVAWDGWHGRGVRTNHPEDYPEYVKGGDIISFDIYPAAHDKPEVAGKLWYVARGVERLVQWTGGQKAVWNCLECTRIQNPKAKATPHQVRAEAWMSLIHGSQGLIYFVHEWQPRFNESALLDDAEMLAEVTALNRQITRLAPVLNSPTMADAVRVSTANAEVPVAAAVKCHGGDVYVFAVAMREGATTATFAFANGKLNAAAGAVQPADASAAWRLRLAPASRVEVIDENRALSVKDGAFQDQFGPWDAHLYRITGETAGRR
jgi:hypothetical protein